MARLVEVAPLPPWPYYGPMINYLDPAVYPVAIALSVALWLGVLVPVAARWNRARRRDRRRDQK